MAYGYDTRHKLHRTLYSKQSQATLEAGRIGTVRFGTQCIVYPTSCPCYQRPHADLECVHVWSMHACIHSFQVDFSFVFGVAAWGVQYAVPIDRQII